MESLTSIEETVKKELDAKAQIKGKKVIRSRER